MSGLKSERLKKRDFTKEGLRNLINKDIIDINSLSDQDLLSIFSFFKFMATEDKKREGIKFLTTEDTILFKYFEEINQKLSKSYKIVVLVQALKEAK